MTLDWIRGRRVNRGDTGACLAGETKGKGCPPASSLSTQIPSILSCKDLMIIFSGKLQHLISPAPLSLLKWLQVRFDGSQTMIYRDNAHLARCPACYSLCFTRALLNSLMQNTCLSQGIRRDKWMHRQIANSC